MTAYEALESVHNWPPGVPVLDLPQKIRWPVDDATNPAERAVDAWEPR